MDPFRRPRHTHRAVARLRGEVREHSGSGRTGLSDVATAGPGAVEYTLANAPAGGGDGANGLTAARPPDCQVEPLEQDAWEPLALLADEIAGQASPGSESAREAAEAMLRSMQRVLGGADSQAALGVCRVPASSPGDLIEALKAATTGPAAASAALPKERVSVPVVRALPAPQPVKQSPRVEILPDGQRVEYFPDGAEVVRDALGRVTEVKSAGGERLSLQYDSCGNLDSFVRTDVRSRVHSEGRRDKHGVVVRDPEGRVRAAGESMTVDPHGRLSIHNTDGQFVSLDLVRALHIERRRPPAADGFWSTVTAVFAHDGFRMVTRFHGVAAEPFAGSGWWLAGADLIRFYGRDGSLVEFYSEEDVRRLHPARVLSPGSVHIDAGLRGRHQAGTAWEAVKEYVEMIS
jgi:YD repeat-containing protein